MNKYELPSYMSINKGTDEYREIVSRRAKIRREALIEILNYIDGLDHEFMPDDVLQAADCLRSKNKEAHKGLPTAVQEIYELFEENEVVYEDALFMNYKYGRLEMKNMIRDIIKKSEPHKRLWIQLFEEEGLYRVIKRGADYPEDWAGYIPPYKDI